MEKFRLDNKISMVTGGSKGIGFGIAKALAEAGSDIVLVARDKTNLDRAREELAGTGRNIRTRSFNMSAVEEIDEMFAGVIKDTGGIDILVNNAGATRRGPAEKITDEDWNLVLNLNVTAVFTLCRAFARERIIRAVKKARSSLYLASAASDFVTGHILYVDGGLLSTFGPSSW